MQHQLRRILADLLFHQLRKGAACDERRPLNNRPAKQRRDALPRLIDYPAALSQRPASFYVQRGPKAHAIYIKQPVADIFRAASPERKKPAAGFCEADV